MFKVQATYTNGKVQVYHWEYATKEEVKNQIKLYKAFDKNNCTMGTKYKVVPA